MKWKCIPTGIEWQYDSCGQTLEEKTHEDPEVNERWKQLAHICPICGNLRVPVKDDK